MTDISFAEMIGGNLKVIVPVFLILIGLLILYFVLIGRVIIQMLRYKIAT